MKIKISKEIHSQLREIVFATKKETGACLFGSYENGDARIAHIAGPGKRSKHQQFKFVPDNKHYEDVYNELLEKEPDLEYLGEFHVHPGTMSELSCGDHYTVKKVLKTYTKFIAGVILRVEEEMQFFPVYFTKDSEVPCELVVD